MPITREHIKIGIFVLIAVAFTILITSIFQGGKKKNELYDKLMQVYEDQKNDLKEQLKNEVDLRNDLRADYEQYMRSDSILLTIFQNNQTKYAPINKRLNDIPNYIKSLGRNGDSIRRAMSEFE